MLQLIEHIIRISSKRDRTEINSALVDAMRDMFDPSALAVYRCYPCTRDTIVFACAGLGPAGLFSYNAYLPERRHCHPIDHDPLLQRCQDLPGAADHQRVGGLAYPALTQPAAALRRCAAACFTPMRCFQRLRRCQPSGQTPDGTAV